MTATRKPENPLGTRSGTRSGTRWGPRRRTGFARECGRRYYAPIDGGIDWESLLRALHGEFTMLNERNRAPAEDPPLFLVGLIISGLVDALNMRHLREELYRDPADINAPCVVPRDADPAPRYSSRPDRRWNAPASSA